MRAAQFLPDVRRVIEERGEPAYRLEQSYLALTRSLVRDWDEATNLPKELRTALSEGAPAATLEKLSADNADIIELDLLELVKQ